MPAKYEKDHHRERGFHKQNCFHAEIYLNLRMAEIFFDGKRFLLKH